MPSKTLLGLIYSFVVVNAAPTATVLNGTYTGVNLPSLSQDVFWGVPFAHQSRFEQATPLNETWEGTRDAIEPGLTCAGYGSNPRFGWPIGEDCLNLNVVRPQDAYPGLDLPVLVWIYGGGWRQGSNRDPEFNTSFMVQTSMEIGHPIIVVSINYRLSAFGFIASTEVAGNGALNIGLQDQRQALRWINENIRAFGGDPNRVTIWGESAGASSVAQQIMAYGGDTQGLFRGGIMVSGSFFGFGQRNIAQGQQVYNNITNHTDCAEAIDTLQCLKDLPFETLNQTVYEQNQGQNFGVVIDNDLLRSYSIVAFNQGRLPPINIITGCNSDEGLSFAGSAAPNTTEELSSFLQESLSINETLASQLLDLYPIDAPAPPYSVPIDYDWQSATAAIGLSTGTQSRRAYAIIGDKMVMAGRRKSANDWSKSTSLTSSSSPSSSSNLTGKAYSFRFDTDPSRFPLVYSPGLGPGFAQHGAELSWEFRLPYRSPTAYPPLPSNVSAMQRESYAMQATFASFVATGSPNRHGIEWVPFWPAYNAGDGDGGASVKRNFVFNATLDDVLNLHVEEDDFRVEGMEWMNGKWPLLDA